MLGLKDCAVNTKLAELLKVVFNLTDKEFDETLTQDDITSWDSLKHMELVIALEKKYDLTLKVEEIIEMNSISTILKILKRKGINVEE